MFVALVFQQLIKGTVKLRSLLVLVLVFRTSPGYKDAVEVVDFDA
jgi:hypothetical protein